MKKLTLFLSTLAFIVNVSSADWTKIDDFEDGVITDTWTLWSTADWALDVVIAEAVQDPADTDNLAFLFDPNTYATGQLPTFMAFNQTIDEIPDGQPFTMYFRLYIAGHSNNIHIGTSSYLIEIDPDTGYAVDSNSWTTFDWLLRPSAKFEDKRFDFRDGTRYVTHPEFKLVEGMWYEFWIYVNNMPGKAGTDEYTTYYKELNGTEVIHLKVPELDADKNYTGNYYDTALFRNFVDEPQRNIIVATNMGWNDTPTAGDLALYDDFHIDYGTELNLTTPDGVVLPTEIVIAPTPERYLKKWTINDINGEKWIEASFGWAEVTNGPYLKMQGINGWTYCPDETLIAGEGWMYLYDNPQVPTADWPVDGSIEGQQWINVEGGIGWVEVTSDPYYLSTSLDAWLYTADRTVFKNGGWVYAIF